MWLACRCWRAANAAPRSARLSLSEPQEVKITSSGRQFRILATEGTLRFLNKNGIEAELIRKIYEGRPNIVDAIKNGEIQLVINTPAGKLSEFDDSYIRKNAIKHKVPYITTTSAALAATKGISDRRSGDYKVKSLQEYHREIME
jgi:carbamoyl-phosphate synthase large subunit